MQTLLKAISKPILVSLISVTVSNPTHAQSAFEDNWIYYDIGGGRAVQDAITQNQLVTLDASVYAGAKYSCGLLDLDENVKQLLDNFKDGVDDLVDAMVFSAEAAVASLPAYILQRANPGLYELFQNALWRYEEQARIAFRNCQEAERLIAQGKNPYKDWVVIAEGTEWGRQAEAGAPATEADAEVYASARRNGLPWKSGNNCGGEGQAVCRVVADSVTAGYEFLHSDDESLLALHFADSEQAAAWAVDVLGDLMIRLSGEGQPAQIPGRGLTPLVKANEEALLETLSTMVVERSQRNTDNFELIAAPGVALTNSVLDAIAALSPSQRATVTARLASEIAAAQIIDKALVVRRLIRAGAREANIAATPAAAHLVNVVIPELDEEIEALAFENEIRQQFVSETAKAVLVERERRNATRLRLTANRKPNLISTGNGGGFIPAE